MRDSSSVRSWRPSGRASLTTWWCSGSWV